MSESGVDNGILYFFDNPTMNGDYMFIFDCICTISGLGITILLFMCHFSRILYVYKTSSKEPQIGENVLNIRDIFPSKDDKYKLGISYYYIYSYHILTILSLLFGLINTIIGVISNLSGDMQIFKCGVSFVIITLSYTLVKFCIYGTGILRIFNTFHGSALAYNNKIKTLLVIYLIVSVGFNCVNVTYFTKGYVIKEDNELEWCQIGANLITMIISSSFEASTNIVLAILFIKPAIILSKNIDQKPESLVLFDIYSVYV